MDKASRFFLLVPVLSACAVDASGAGSAQQSQGVGITTSTKPPPVTVDTDVPSMSGATTAQGGLTPGGGVPAADNGPGNTPGDGPGNTPGNGSANTPGGGTAAPGPGETSDKVTGDGDTMMEMAMEPCAANMEETAADADPCTAPLRPGDDRLCEFSFGGETRRFYVYAPPSFNACEPASLVMDMHGASESIEVHIGIETFSGSENPLGYGSSWRRAIQGDNVVVATPEGIGLRWSRANDPDFLNEVADMVEAMADVDPEKRYLSGISMGGMITVQTGCEDTHRWRGMAPVAMLSNGCSSVDRPTPHIAFHATGDSLTSYADDRDLAEQMADNNNCDATPETVNYGGPNSSDEPVCFEMPYGPGSEEPDDPYAVPITACPSDRPESSCDIWTGCDEDVEVRFCTVEAGTQRLGGHLLYTNDTGLHLARMTWLFFKSFW